MVGFAVYASALDAPFVLDDYSNIVENPFVHWDSLRLDWLRQTLFAGPTARPVANLTFALDHWAHGLDPRGFRVVNVAILVASALLLARFARVLLARLRPPVPEPAARGIAWIAALLFVAHPLQIQSTTYIVQRMTGLAVLFTLAALLAWLRAREGGSRGARLRWGALAVSLWLLAVGAKEIAITGPVAAWLCEWFFWRDLDPHFARRSFLLVGLPLLVCGVAAYALLTHDLAWGYAGKPFTPSERLLTELRVVVFYLSLFVWPLPSRLNLLHDFPLSHSLLDPPTTALSLLLLLALAAVAVLAARRAPLVSFALVWCALQLLIESAILPLALAFEHRMALPLVGLCLGAAWLLFAALRMRTAPALALGLAAVTALGVATARRNALWSDELAFWTDVAQKSPHVLAAQTNLGMALLRAGRPQDAEAATLRALAIDPTDAEALNNLGSLRLARGDRAGALSSFEQALHYAPDHFRAHFNLGMVLGESGDVARGLEHLEAAVESAPYEASVWNGLGALRLLQGDLDAADAALRRALELDPGQADARANLARVQALRSAKALRDASD
ncbi:MAG TPA: tetratricopeptide repeat protein [Myxococcota bacterium]|nr:tetratricopeptide repeat protein [Myxococcota bacterium]